MNTQALTTNTAFNLLLSLEEAVLRNGGEVPKNTDAREQWPGVKCVVAGMNFIAPLNQVGEILEPVSVTLIPGCAPWVRGLMNVRGRLLPVFGLSEFFSGGRSRSGAGQIIVVEQGAVFCGIAVDKVFGMQKFLGDDFKERELICPSSLSGILDYVGLSVAADNDNWFQLDIARLAARMVQTNPAATSANENRTDTPRPPVDTAAEGAMAAGTAM